jgi:hypothetical protein
MTNFQIMLCLGAAFFLLMYYMDRRRWANFPREELVRGATGEDYRLWRPYLKELRRRGEDIAPFMPRLLRALVGDTKLKRVAGKMALSDLYPDIKPVLKDFQGTADLATCRAQVAPLLAMFGLDAEGDLPAGSPAPEAGRKGYQSYLTLMAESGDELLDDWRWLTGPDLHLWHATKMGDAFLRHPADGSIHFLDTVSGEVERIANDEADFERVIASEDNADRWLMREVVDMQAMLGMRPGPDQCLSFRNPPVLGGQLLPDNFDVVSLIVHLSVAGQIHEQVKDLPEGAPIPQIELRPPGGGESVRL